MILYHTDLGRVLFLGQKLAMTVASGRVANCLYLVLSSGLDSKDVYKRQGQTTKEIWGPMLYLVFL